MEDIIDVYERPYARKRPVVCLDEKPSQLLGEVREPLPMRPSAVEKIDAEYYHQRNNSKLRYDLHNILQSFFR